MRSRSLAQNFLANRRTARRIVQMANGPSDALCVDLGAGNGRVTEAALMRPGRVEAVEVDPRLAARLRERFADEPRVSVIECDLLESPLPAIPFIIAANPPFNQSTRLVERWMLAEQFISGAIVVEKAFGQRVAGHFGTTKLSLSLAPYVQLDLAAAVRSEEFRPQPSVRTGILTAVRRDTLLPWKERRDYWLFVNYLFERSRATVGEALQPLGLNGLTRIMREMRVRDLSHGDAVALYRLIRDAPNLTMATVGAFEEALPARRQSNLAAAVER